ncbi:MAG: HutD family protein [Lachnospiraceae bacterium]|jgi:environmental stress-induced protein Ves|nr:HutD family protein [Lachnospiraceae bacterium]MDD3615429.1 HutD family protein [Lachnospiraceae bacterium]
MKNRFEVRKEFSTNQWSGGSTTEFYLYPENGSYQKRDFLFRISSAVVEESPSMFTSLPGVTRTLMLLEGNMKLIHGKKEPLSLMPGKCDVFSGDVKTVSVGLATDFNLMVKDETDGTVESICLLPKDRETFAIYPKKNKECFLLLYVYSGEVCVQDGQEIKKVEMGELGIINIKDEDVQGFTIKNTGSSSAKLIRTIVYTRTEDTKNILLTEEVSESRKEVQV